MVLLGDFGIEGPKIIQKKLFLQGSINESKATVVYFKVFSKAIDIVSKVNSFLPYVWYRCFETCVRFGIRVCIARLQVLHKFRIGATEIWRVASSAPWVAVDRPMQKLQPPGFW